MECPRQKLHAPQKTQLTTHTKIVQIPTTMAAADAPYEHLPMELRPPCYTYREEITSASYGYNEKNLIRLVLHRPPAAHLRYCLVLHTYQRHFANHGLRRRPTEPFPWRYGPDITPIERKSTLIHKGSMGHLCWICLVLGFRRYPYTDFCLRGSANSHRQHHRGAFPRETISSSTPHCLLLWSGGYC